LKKAIERDANFSAPHSGIAISSFYNITHGFTTDATATLERLLAEALEAVALDGADAAAHTALGLALMEGRNLDKSLHEHGLAVSLSPNSAYANWAFGYALLRANRNQEALDRFDIALRLSPRDPLVWSYLTLKSASLYRLLRYDEAAILAQEATTHTPRRTRYCRMCILRLHSVNLAVAILRQPLSLSFASCGPDLRYLCLGIGRTIAAGRQAG
jgi:tetratricopeptide (TPR) repeat protein